MKVVYFRRKIIYEDGGFCAEELSSKFASTTEDMAALMMFVML